MRVLFINFLLVSLFLIQACTPESVSPLATSSTSTEDVEICGEYSTDFMAGQFTDIGEIRISNSEDMLYVTFSTTGDWYVGKTHLYVGSLEDMPRTPTGNPKIGNFPYQDTHSPLTQSFTYAIPLSELGTCFVVAAHAEAHRLDASGEIVQSETAWGSGEQINTGGSWAMMSSYCIAECEPCEIVAQTYDLFGGQDILVGNLSVTNDDENIYVSYTTTGDWYIAQTHLYVGSLEGLPVNGAGTPMPGHFPYKDEFDPYVQTYTYTIPISSVGLDCFIIAAHASVVQVVDGEEVSSETAWSFGTPFPDTDRWGWYSEYCLQHCE